MTTCSTAEPAALNLSLDHTEDLRARLRKQIEEISLSSKFCLERFAATDDDIRFYTRKADNVNSVFQINIKLLGLSTIT